MTLAFPKCLPREAGERSKTMDARNDALKTEVTSQDGLVWETPSFVEIRMDAEVGSYQDDFDSDDWH